MNASNHMVTGAVIALTITEPLLTLPLALASHYVLDAMPHFGFERKGFDVWRNHRSGFVLLAWDVGASVVVMTVLLLGTNSWLPLLAALMALSPDLVWPYRYFRYDVRGLDPPFSWPTRIHLAIQWCEKPWGIWVEILFFIVAMIVLFQTL